MTDDRMTQGAARAVMTRVFETAQSVASRICWLRHKDRCTVLRSDGVCHGWLNGDDTAARHRVSGDPDGTPAGLTATRRRPISDVFVWFLGSQNLHRDCHYETYLPADRRDPDPLGL